MLLRVRQHKTPPGLRSITQPLTGHPVWSTIDAGHLAKFPVLAGISELYIGQDQDGAGIAAATNCAQRWADAGQVVYVTQQLENDLNDVINVKEVEK